MKTAADGMIFDPPATASNGETMGAPSTNDKPGSTHGVCRSPVRGSGGKISVKRGVMALADDSAMTDRAFRKLLLGVTLGTFGATWVATDPGLSPLWAESAASEKPNRSAFFDPPQPTATYYRNCDAVRAAGRAPLYRGSPGYRAPLDRDNDGVACEPYYGN